MRRAVPMFAIACAITTACAPVAGPRFPDDVASAIADHDMRRMETDALIVYYPAGQQALARRVAARAQGCALAVRARAEAVAMSKATPDKPVLVIPDLPLNNAFVIPRLAGAETIGVVATHSTLDFTTTFGLPPDPGFVACHELVHAIHEQQITGGWAMINRIFGSTASPQLGLDAWFWEGVAVHYESALQPGAGRLAWPIWRGTFAAGYAGGDDLDGDDLNEYKRLAASGHHYVVGSHFVAWLIERYGENRLWSVVNAQAGAIVFPLSVSGRFEDAYGKDLPDLVDEWRRHVARTIPRRAPPASQTTIRAFGNDARYARSPGGVEAVVWSDNDVATRLTVIGADGNTEFDRELVSLLPLDPTLTIASPLLVSGMSFSDDSKLLYFTVIDAGKTYQRTRLMRLRLGDWRLQHIADDLGPGGAVSPDGQTYWVAEVDGDAWGLAAVDLLHLSHERRVVIEPEPGRYILRVAPSPSGNQLALSVWDGTRFAIWIVDAATGDRLSVIEGGAGNAPVYDASWVGDARIVYLKDIDNRFQVAVNAWQGGAEQIVTDAPYTAFEPRAANGTVRFLDRSGWKWMLSEASIPVAEPAPPPAPVPALTPTPPATLPTISDTPYTLTDGLLRPQLHGLGLAAPSEGSTLLGLVLGGGDRLGQQRWAIAGYLQPSPEPIRYSWAAQYHNAMLAPWSLSLTASDFRWHHGVDEDPDEPGFESYEPRRQLDLTASVGRIWYGRFAGSLDGIVSRDAFEGEPVRELAGGGVSLVYDHGSGTPRGGTRWQVFAALSAAHFPARASSIGRLTDLRADGQLVMPLLGKTSSFRLRSTSRRMYPERDLIEVGAGGPFSSLYDTTHHADPVGEPPPIDDALLPDHVRFSEPVRGFEDLSFPASRVHVTEVAMRVPVIIEAGWISSLWVLPPTLVRELQLEAFYVRADVESAIDPDGALHAAFGASATLALALWRAPVLVRWQVAKRRSDDRAITQFVGLGVGF